LLVLTRKNGQEILLSETGIEGVCLSGHKIKIAVVGITKGKVRLGIEAPEGIEILRSELVQERCDENRHGDAKEDVPGCVS